MAAALAAAWTLLAPAHLAFAQSDPQTCSACHGPEGRSTNPDIPSLAGEPQQFIATSLYLFREGTRKNEVMSPLAAGLSNADLNSLAAYFSGQAPTPPARAADPSIEAAAQDLIKRNRCTSCHGPELVGLQQMPRLAGQQRDYLVRQLHAFKEGTRGELDGQMGQAAQPLTDADITLLADYLSSLQR
jgi:cytochrome c553